MTELIPDTLLADSTITALCGNRVKPAGTNQGEAFPYITFQVISDTPTRCREGITVETLRVQVSAFGRTYREQDDLYYAIRNALDGAKNSLVECQYLNASDIGRQPGDAFGKAIDFQLITQ